MWYDGRIDFDAGCLIACLRNMSNIIVPAFIRNACEHYVFYDLFTYIMDEAILHNN